MRVIGASPPNGRRCSSAARAARRGPGPDNPVLATYKFTNAYRASDRVSQYLIRHVIYRADLPKSPREVFFRILLFKLFNKIETWELLERALGPITFEDYHFAPSTRCSRARCRTDAASIRPPTSCRRAAALSGDQPSTRTIYCCSNA